MRGADRDGFYMEWNGPLHILNTTFNICGIHLVVPFPVYDLSVCVCVFVYSRNVCVRKRAQC